jgi:hypothetical protein
MFVRLNLPAGSNSVDMHPRVKIEHVKFNNFFYSNCSLLPYTFPVGEKGIHQETWHLKTLSINASIK